MRRFTLLTALTLLSGTLAMAEDLNFGSHVGDLKVSPVVDTKPLPLPVLTWGADVATFWANGGTGVTKPDSLFGKSGLSYKIVNGDDFKTQVKNYAEGKTPYLRGAFTQIAEAASVLSKDAGTKPVVIFQLSKSKGDHIVGRSEIKTLNDVKGKTICAQMDGPHIALIEVALTAANLKWSDVKIVWAKNLTGPDSPTEMFRKDPSIDMACVISPDMASLTGGLGQVGTGAETTIKGAHVVMSTNDATEAIADVYAVRSDYLAAHRTEVGQFVAAYLKASELLATSKKAYNDGKGKAPEYLNILKQAQVFYGADVLPTIEVDAHGLVSDATLVGLPGNVAFFTDAGNLNGFQGRLKSAQESLSALGAIPNGWTIDLDTGRWDWTSVAKSAGLTYTAPRATQRVNAESVDLFPDSNLDDRTIVTFVIQFEPNQQGFDINAYADKFAEAVRQAQTFGNCVVAIRGHSDPTKTLVDFLKAGMALGTIKRSGSQAEGFQYFFNNKPLDMTQTAVILKAITAGDFGKADPNPQDTMQAAFNLSQTRAEQVKRMIIEYAKQKGLNLDPSQIQPVGVGIKEPVVAKPKNISEAKKNMRVEFRLIRVPAEAIKSDEFDLLGK